MVVDDRLFHHFRVPNGNVLITPVIVNDNLIDVTIEPTEPGQPANVDWRPKTAAFSVRSEVKTVPAGQPKKIELEISPHDRSVGIVKGQIPVGYKPELPGVPTLVQTFSIEDPSAFARTAFIEALGRAGVTVSARFDSAGTRLRSCPAPNSYKADAKVTEFVSPPYGQYARLILKVSHNLGANLSLMLFAQTKDAKTIKAALAAERKTLTSEYGLRAGSFDFPTNGSGSPDSRATPGGLMQLLTEMRASKEGQTYFDALPILGVDGSLAIVGKDPLDPVDRSRLRQRLRQDRHDARRRYAQGAGIRRLHKRQERRFAGLRRLRQQRLADRRHRRRHKSLRRRGRNLGVALRAVLITRALSRGREPAAYLPLSG